MSATELGTPPLSVLDEIWHKLRHGIDDLQSPLRLPTLVTAHPDRPEARILVLRKADASTRTLQFHTDFRSAKIQHLQKNPNSLWVFYEPVSLTQILARGPSTIHSQDDLARTHWDQTPTANRINYCTAKSPGAEIQNPCDALPADWRERGLDSELGWPNFTVVETVVEEIEWLQLSHEGHRKARFQWNTGKWISQWLVP